MKQNFILGCSFVAFFLAPSSPIQSDPVPENIQKAFSLFAVQAPYRHRFEKFNLQNKRLEMDLWYEDASVTKRGEPTDALFCKISHILIYGRHKSRTANRSPALTSAFQEIPDMESAKLTFFSVFYTNKPQPAGTNPSKLRVIWSREEQIIPYLTYSISRGEWKTLSTVLKNTPNPSFEDYQNKLCANVLKVAPNLKANFKAIQDYLAKTRGGESK